MESHPASIGVVGFGAFELDGRTGELRRHGQKIRLPHQSFQILRLLLSRPGDVVTREELRQALWTAETFVDFDVGLNSAVRKLREALDDSAERPRFVETLPRRGYRFIGDLENPAPAPALPEPRTAAAEQPVIPPPTAATHPGLSRRAAWLGGAALVAALAVPGGLALPQRIASKLTTAIGRPASSAAEARPRRPADPVAYDSYLKGMTAAGAQRYEGYRAAVGYYEQAIAKQPDFAEAHAALAFAQFQFLFGGPLSPRDAMPKAEAAARKAIELDDTLALAHRTLGLILTHFYWQWDEGEREFRRAAELSRGTNAPAGNPGLALIRDGRIDEAVAEAERARAKDPLSFAAQVNLGTAYRAAGQFDRAIAELRHALEMSPGHVRAHFQLGITYAAIDDIHAAIREFEAATSTPQGRNTRMLAYLGYAYARAGRAIEARRVLADLESRRRQQYVSSFGIALIHDALGEKGPALVALERAFEDRAVEFAQMPQYPPFKTIASEPGYADVMRRIGLPRPR